MWLNTKWRLKKLITFQVWLLRFSCRRELRHCVNINFSICCLGKVLKVSAKFVQKWPCCWSFPTFYISFYDFPLPLPPRYFGTSFSIHAWRTWFYHTSQSRQSILTLAWETDVDTFAHFCCLFYGVILSCCLTSFHTNLLPFSLVPRS